MLRFAPQAAREAAALSAHRESAAQYARARRRDYAAGLDHLGSALRHAGEGGWEPWRG